MAPSGSLNKYWYWALLLAMGAVIAAAALVAPGKISRLELEREASVAAARLKTKMLQEPDALFHALGRPSSRPRFGDILAKTGYGHRVLRYELYDRDGQLAFTSGLAGLKLEEELASLLASPAREEAKVTLYQSSAKASPSNFAAVALPLALNGEPRDTLVVYLDQSDQAKVLSGYFGWVTANT
jgi:hypothetical protein